MARPTSRVLAFCVFALAGCAAKAPDSAQALERFEFLQAHRTLVSEVTDRLGPPASEHENGRLLVYLIALDRNEQLRVAAKIEPWGGFNLVMLFDTDGVLEHHTMVAVR